MGDGPKQHAGFRFTQALIDALDDAAGAQGITRTQLVETWLQQRATAEGWMEDAVSDDRQFAE